jgi:hypothetical protein
MGINIALWRARIGSFIQKNSCSNKRLDIKKSQHRGPLFSTKIAAISIYLLSLVLIIGCVESHPGPDNFKCQSCNAVLKDIQSFTNHLSLHCNDSNFHFTCPVKKCLKTFRSKNSFRNHYTSYHTGATKIKLHTFNSVSTIAAIKCTDSVCNMEFPTIQLVVKHLKSHLNDGVQKVACPFQSCINKYFSTIKSFSTHISTYHQTSDTSNINVIDNHDLNDQDDLNIETDNFVDEPSEINDESDNIEVPYEDLIKIQLIKFYIKLEAQHCVPASIVQIVAEELKNLTQLLHEQKEEHIRKNINKNEKLIEHENDIINLCQEYEYIYKLHNKKDADGDDFSTQYGRNKYFKKFFNICMPISLYLGNQKTQETAYCQFVPISETLKSLVNNTSFCNYINIISAENTNVESTINTENDVLSDYTDGSVYKKYHSHDVNNVIDIFLYRDDFEIVNPIGSARVKHKLSATYFTIGNLPPFIRSKLSSIFLVSLCKTRYIKHYESVLNEAIIKDLEVLQSTGFQWGNNIIKARLIFIQADNLGAHEIGGFLKSFRCDYFCRYCEITRDEFKNNAICVHPLRTEESHDKILSELQAISAADVKIKSVRGVRENCAFHKLIGFHICHPRLVCCIGHDLFEGVIDIDVPLIMKHILNTEKWLTLEIFNKLLYNFKFPDENVCKPVALKPPLERLCGNASQNWALIRYMPLIIFDYIKNADDSVWQCFLKLKEIVELCVAPKISHNQIAHLHRIISEYLELRKELFPSNEVKPKHHYMMHFPQLILKFGPLIRLWTLRFESKHSYFKRVARATKNFLNVTKSLAEKHQKLLAYKSSGELYVNLLDFQGASKTNINNYNGVPLSLISKYSLQDSYETSRVQLNSINYKIGHWVILSSHNYEPTLGNIRIIFIKNDDVFFFVEKFNTIKCVKTGDLIILNDTTDIKFDIIKSNNLHDYYPLSSSDINGCLYLTLKHSLLV